MMPLVRRALTRALIVLAPIAALTAPAAAQFGFQPPTGPATASCTPFTGFPLALNLGQRADGLDGISSRCGFQRTQDGLNLLAGQRGQPNGLATLNSAGVVPISQIPATVALPTAVPTLTITGTGSTGAIDGMSVTSPDANASPVPLATRIQNTPLIPADFQIKCDGTTDDAPNIRKAVAALRYRPNASLQLPNGVCAIASTISAQDWSNISLIGAGGSTGAGSGTNAQDGTVLKWIGPANGIMLDLQSPAATRPYLTSATTVRGIMLDGNGLAGKGVYARGLYDTKIAVKFRNVTQIGVDIDIYQGGGADVQQCEFGPINGDLSYPASVYAKGLVFGPGSSYNNIHHNIIKSVSIIHQAGAGIEIGNADSNTFIGLQAQYPVDGSGTLPGGNGSSRTGPGLDLRASPNALGPGGVTQAARDNVFVNVSIPSGTFARAGSFNLPTYGNMIKGFVRGSGEPAPVIEAGAQLEYDTSYGDHYMTKTYTRQQFWQSLGDFMVMLRNQAGATIGYLGSDGIFSTGTPAGSFRIRGDTGIAIGAGNSPAIGIDTANNLNFPALKTSPNDGDAAAQGVALGAIYYNSTIGALRPRQ